MPVCPVFAVGLDGKCGTAGQRLQGGPDRDRLPADAAPVSATIDSKNRRFARRPRCASNWLNNGLEDRESDRDHSQFAIAAKAPAGARLKSPVTNDGKTQLRDPAAQCARVVHEFLAPKNRGRAGCRVHDAPAASCAVSGGKNAHEYSQRRHRKTPGIPARNGFNAYIVLSPVTGLLSPSLTD